MSWETQQDLVKPADSEANHRNQVQGHARHSTSDHRVGRGGGALAWDRARCSAHGPGSRRANGAWWTWPLLPIGDALSLGPG